MKLHVLAVGARGPRWAEEACAEYRKRFPPHCPLSVTTIPAPRRGRNPDIPGLREKEYETLLSRVPRGGLVVLLDETGRTYTTVDLARQLDKWMQSHREAAFLIGGPDGLPPPALEKAAETWSLSPLTLPHALARVVVVEQLYRALSVLEDHPYHRGG